jgi:hypothetical protein
LDVVFSPDLGLPAHGRLLFYRGRSPQAPIGEVAALGLRASDDRARLAVPGDDGPIWQDRPVAAVVVVDALEALLAPRAASSASVTSYVRATRLAVGLVAEHQVAPVLRRVGDEVVATWQALLPGGGAAADTLRALADALPPTGHALPVDDGGVWHPRTLLRTYVDAVTDALVRTPADASADRTRPRARLLPWTARWREAATDRADPVVPLGPERGEVLAGVREWLRPYEQRPVEHIPELTLRPPDDRDGAWRLRFGLRERDGAQLDATQVWRDGGAHADRVEALLAALARAARVCPPIERALDQREPTEATLDVAEAWRFIDRTSTLLTDAGYAVTLPDAVDDLRPRLRLGASGEDDRLDGSVGVRWQGVVGGEVVDTDTVDALLQSDQPLVFWDGRWVRVPAATRSRAWGRARPPPSWPT